MWKVLALVCCIEAATGLKIQRESVEMEIQTETELDSEAPKAVKKCDVPANFVRKVNDRVHRKPTQDEMSRPDFFDEPYLKKIYYINLDKSVRRRESIEMEIAVGFPGVQSQRWKATSKNELEAFKPHRSDYSELIGRKWNDAGAGAQATYYSHYLALQNISKEEDSNAVYIIVEDDVHLNRPGLKENVLCQLKMLPPEWDVFKFGYWGFSMQDKPKKKTDYPYPNCAGEALNEYTCHQEHFNWNYMGNLAYAVRPQGARVLMEHFRKTPIMDVDGAMMPGITWDEKVGKPLWPNTYVSIRNMVDHGGFRADRVSFKNAAKEESLDDKVMANNDFVLPDMSTFLSEASLPDDESGRETTTEAKARFEKGDTWVDTLRDDQFD